MLNENVKRVIATTLLERIGNSYECPICHSHKFKIFDGYIFQFLQDDISNPTPNPPVIPSVSIVCTNCGFTSLHNLGVLGLIEKKNDMEEEVDKKL